MGVALTHSHTLIGWRGSHLWCICLVQYNDNDLGGHRVFFFSLILKHVCCQCIFHKKVQLSAVVMRSNVSSWYYMALQWQQHNVNQTLHHNRHRIPRPDRRAMGCLLGEFWRKIEWVQITILTELYTSLASKYKKVCVKPTCWSLHNTRWGSLHLSESLGMCRPLQIGRYFIFLYRWTPEKRELIELVSGVHSQYMHIFITAGYQ